MYVATKPASITCQYIGPGGQLFFIPVDSVSMIDRLTCTGRGGLVRAELDVF